MLILNGRLNLPLPCQLFQSLGQLYFNLKDNTNAFMQSLHTHTEFCRPLIFNSYNKKFWIPELQERFLINIKHTFIHAWPPSALQQRSGLRATKSKKAWKDIVLKDLPLPCQLFQCFCNFISPKRQHSMSCLLARPRPSCTVTLASHLQFF